MRVTHAIPPKNCPKLPNTGEAAENPVQRRNEQEVKNADNDENRDR